MCNGAHDYKRVQAVVILIWLQKQPLCLTCTCKSAPSHNPCFHQLHHVHGMLCNVHLSAHSSHRPLCHGMLRDLPLSAHRRVQKAEPYRLTGAAAPLAIQAKEHGRPPGSFIAGFVKGAAAAPFPLFPAPQLPPSYQPIHKFAEPLRTGIVSFSLVQMVPVGLCWSQGHTNYR